MGLWGFMPRFLEFSVQNCGVVRVCRGLDGGGCAIDMGNSVQGVVIWYVCWVEVWVLMCVF